MLFRTLSRCAVLLTLWALLSACGGGGSGSSSVNNTPPVANAGSNQSVSLPATVTLDGSASSDADGDTLTYAWTLTTVPNGSAAALSNVTAAKPTFTPDVAGTYVARLIVSDGTTTSAASLVTIAVGAANTAPVANAGSNQSVNLPATVTLDGTASSDADGDPLTYAWTLTTVPTGSAAALSGATTAKPTFTPDVAGTYVARLIVSDGTTASAASLVTIAVGAANGDPVANAGSNQSVSLPATVTLDGTASRDADGDPLTYAWTLTTVPTGSTAALSGATAAKPTFVPDLPGTYIARLIVSDGTTASAPATVTISVSATVSLVTNGSFEASLTGWSQGVGPASPSGTSCGWNAASPAPGTEAVTGTAGFPATDGTGNAVGGLIKTAVGTASCVLYQDIAIPAGATTMAFSSAIGFKYVGGKPNGNAAVVWGLFSTSAIPDSTSTPLMGAYFAYEPIASDSTLTSISTGNIDVSSYAGQTVRLAFINATNVIVGSSVAGVDNVKLIAVVTH